MRSTNVPSLEENKLHDVKQKLDTWKSLLRFTKASLLIKSVATADFPFIHYAMTNQSL